MSRADYSYEGFYARFVPEVKKDAGLLMGADNIVGNDFEVFFELEDEVNVAKLKNKFGAIVGRFDTDTSRKLHLADARGQKIRAILSFIAFSDTEDMNGYWGEMGLFCYNPAYAEEMDAFVDRCAEKMGEGLRPNIDLGSGGVDKIFSEKDWIPSDTTPFPAKEPGMAILKDRASFSEKMIEQGRARNKGCYVVSWAFIIVVIAAIVYGLHSAGLF